MAIDNQEGSSAPDAVSVGLEECVQLLNGPSDERRYIAILAPIGYSIARLTHVCWYHLWLQSCVKNGRQCNLHNSA